MNICMGKENREQGNSVCWRQKCIDRFKLLPFPMDSVPKGLQVLSESNDATWERYYKFRSLHADGEVATTSDCADTDTDEQTSSSSRTHSDSEDEKSEDDMNAELLLSLNDSVKELAKGLDCSWWTSHMNMSIPDATWEEIDELRTVTIRTVSFSPYAIPHAVVLEHRHHSRNCNNYSSEFYCYWHFNLLRFDGVGIKSRLMNGVFLGDHVTEKLAELWPANGSFDANEKAFPQLYHADKEMEVLCSNSLKDPPDLGGRGNKLWMTVENIDVSNFTPATITRIRQWILGTSFSPFLSDFDFIKLLFASYGCLDFDLDYYSRGNLGHHWEPNEGFGYHWTPSDDVRAQLKDMGEPEHVSTCWLEYQARLVGGALRPCDRFYQPYNELDARSEWGVRVLEAINHGELDPELVLKDGQTLDDLCKIAPRLVWEHASQSSVDGIGDVADLMKMVMAQVGIFSKPSTQ